MTAVRRFFSDTATMTRRSFKLSLHSLDSIITTVVLPVMILFAFIFIFGGAISTGATGNYTNYIVPGIIVLGVGQVSASVSVTIATMKQKGILNRFKTMDIVQSSVLLGEMNVSLAKNVASSALVVGCAMLIGFEPNLGWGRTLLLVLFIMLFAAVIIWISIFFGLVASPEAAASFSMALIFIPYLSSGFVPVSTMPGWLQAVSENSPFTPVTEVIRGLLMNTLDMSDVWRALAWLVGLLALGVFVAVRRFNRLTVR